jgi:uncharacterized protein (DUF2235 family)
MRRILIVCIDGTWNSSAEESRFKSYPTNVERISKLLINDGKTQRVVYRPGVGTRGYIDRLIGGVWGSGTTRLICDGYRFLCEHYQPDDELALFGFSRGAFAVRAIVGIIARIGVVRFDQLEYVPKAVYLARRPLWMGRADTFSAAHCYKEVVIAFVGVWDTVIRYGPVLAPVRKALELAQRMHFGLFDQKIPYRVRHFCHALALDERRGAFWPWRAINCGEVGAQQQVEELWFAGRHSDVGGGNADTGLSEIALQWMIERAQDFGLVFHKAPFVSENCDLAVVNPSQIGIWRLLRSRRRLVEDSDRLHASVIRRMRAGLYQPAARLPKSVLDSITADEQP